MAFSMNKKKGKNSMKRKVYNENKNFCDNIFKTLTSKPKLIPFLTLSSLEMIESYEKEFKKEEKLTLTDFFYPTLNADSLKDLFFENTEKETSFEDINDNFRFLACRSKKTKKYYSNELKSKIKNDIYEHLDKANLNSGLLIIFFVF